MNKFDGLSNDQLYTALKQVRESITIERGRYQELIGEASRRRIPNTKLSRVLDVSEAAIRNYKKRKGL